eukprot:308191-Prymnesium_polylepis.1
MTTRSEVRTAGPAAFGFEVDSKTGVPRVGDSYHTTRWKPPMIDASASVIGAEIGPDCVIGVNVVLGKGAFVGAGSTIMDGATVGAGSMIGKHVVVGSGAVIEDRATLEDHAKVEDGAKVGSSWASPTTISRSAIVGVDSVLGVGCSIEA